ncbi:hypothetical protein AGOR_G00207030 [Albula goreensis]|uniref:Cathepsin L1-like n=1 Tax=Albula goreensis TaxID=1534307 RepID=A0A8T3CP25_9TELE|nr:hypothetical protein AGOR_G00207030 [Albula goreensis]
MERRVAVLIVFAVGVSSLHAVDHTLDSVWENWKSLHGKEYTQDSEGKRRMIWEENHRFINQHNQEEAQGKHSYKLGMNQFGDLTNEEFREKMLGFDLNLVRDSSIPVWNGSVRQAPKEVDWRKKGYVTPVKNQSPQGRECGSCWAFSSTGALEGQMFRKTRQLVSLSEQNLVDCSKRYGNKGCKGGLMSKAFQYIKDNGGLASERSYPYEAQDNKPCRYKSNQRAAYCKGYQQLRPGDEMALRDAVVVVGPVSMSVNASLKSFQYYSSGIYFDVACSNVPDHAMLAVGFGESKYEQPSKFWILKNSWGPNWGENGYMRLAREYRNHCGIGHYSVYPEV